ncbi:MAG: hypothetical protein JXA11_08150 [Phycisphaerae bacterium]|nr:hypothetical protein [Phycisphaerae bacterium]
MNHALQILVRLLSQQSVQIAAVFLIVLVAGWLLRRRSAHWRYMLWLVVLIKCVTPPAVSIPLALLPVEAPAKSQINLPAATNGVVAPAVSSVAPKWTAAEPSNEAKGTRHPGTAYSQEPNASTEPVATVAAGKPAARPSAVRPSTIISSSPSQPAWNWWVWIGLAWICGTVAFGAFVLLRAWWIHATLKRSRRPVGELLRQETTNLARTMGLKRGPTAWLVDGYAQPFVWGLWRGSLYLPADFDSLTVTARRQILAHELAHIVRCDAAVNALQILAQGLFFFHPLVWFANRQIRREREKCCDEIAIATRIAQPRQYTTAIVDALLRGSAPRRPISTLAVAGPVKNLEERIKTILTPGREFLRRPTWSAILTVLLLAVVVTPTALTLTARAEEEKPAKKDEVKAPAKANAPEESIPTVTLPDGVTVELLAVSKYPSSTGWWRPSGEVIANATYETNKNTITPQTKYSPYQFLYRVKAGDKKGVATARKIESIESGSLEVKGNTNLKCFYAMISEDQAAGSLSIGVAAGEWNTEASYSAEAMSSGGDTITPDGIIACSIEKINDNYVLMISDNRPKGDMNRRIVAVGNNGTIFKPFRFGISSLKSNRYNRLTAVFRDIPKENLKEFRYQTRPYEWARFNNISLEPGKLQRVEVHYEGAEKPDTERSRPEARTSSERNPKRPGSPPHQKQLPPSAARDSKYPIESWQMDTVIIEEEKNTRAKLKRTIPKLSIDAAPFQEVMDYLQLYSKLNLFVNYGEIDRKLKAMALEKENALASGYGGPGIPPDMMMPQPGRRASRTISTRRPTVRGRSSRATSNDNPADSRKVVISIHLKDVSVEDALRRTLDAAGGAMGVQLGYAVDGTMVVVSTREGIQMMTPRLDAQGKNPVGGLFGNSPCRVGRVVEPPQPPKEYTEKEKAEWRKLQRRIPKIELTDVRLEDCMIYLREVSNLNLFVNYGLINQDMHGGKCQDVRIRVNLSDALVEDVLRRILDNVSARTGIRLVYTIDGPMVVVTMREGLHIITPRLNVRDKNSKDSLFEEESTTRRGGSPQQPPKDFIDKEQAEWRKLQRQEPKVELADVRFEDSMDFLRDISKVNLFVNYDQINREMNEYQNSRKKCQDTPVNLDLKDASIEDVLRRILDCVAGLTGVPLGYTLDGPMVVISTRKGILDMPPRITESNSRNEEQPMSGARAR